MKKSLRNSYECFALLGEEKSGVNHVKAAFLLRDFKSSFGNSPAFGGIWRLLPEHQRRF